MQGVYALLFQPSTPTHTLLYQILAVFLTNRWQEHKEEDEEDVNNGDEENDSEDEENEHINACIPGSAIIHLLFFHKQDE